MERFACFAARTCTVGEGVSRSFEKVYVPVSGYAQNDVIHASDGCIYSDRGTKTTGTLLCHGSSVSKPGVTNDHIYTFFQNVPEYYMGGTVIKCKFQLPVSWRVNN